jgi:hypothetical protein
MAPSVSRSGLPHTHTLRNTSPFIQTTHLTSAYTCTPFTHQHSQHIYQRHGSYVLVILGPYIQKPLGRVILCGVAFSPHSVNDFCRDYARCNKPTAIKNTLTPGAFRRFSAVSLYGPGFGEASYCVTDRQKRGTWPVLRLNKIFP